MDEAAYALLGFDRYSVFLAATRGPFEDIDMFAKERLDALDSDKLDR